MIQLHATKALFTLLPLNEQGQFFMTPRTRWLYQQPAIENNPLNGWQGHVVTMQRRHCVFMVHVETRFALFIPALKKDDFKNVNDLFIDAFMNTLMKCGAEEKHMDVAHKLLRPLQVDAATDRSVQAHLNQMKFEVECLLEDEPVNLAEMTGYSIGVYLSKALRTIKGKGFVRPDQEMLRLMDAACTHPPAPLQ